MADDYTPTTEQVRAQYADGETRGSQADYAEFDRWLAAHDAQKRAEWEAEQEADEPMNIAQQVTDDMVAEALDAKASMSKLHCYLYSTEKCRCGEEWTDAHWMRFILERALSRAEREAERLPPKDNPNITPEGIEVKSGQRWRSLDKRDSGRTVTVESVENGKARVTSGVTRSTLSIKRMRRMSTGWALINENGESR